MAIEYFIKAAPMVEADASAVVFFVTDNEGVRHFAVESSLTVVTKRKQGMRLAHCYLLDKHNEPLAILYFYKVRNGLMPALLLTLEGQAFLAGYRFPWSYNWPKRALVNGYLDKPLVSVEGYAEVVKKACALGYPARLGLLEEIL